MSTKMVSETELPLQTGRIEALDIAKGIGMFFVVWAHVNYTPFLLKYIYSFHMPLFFIISGILYNKEKYSSFPHYIKRRAKTLICPYIFFYLGSLLIVFVLRVVGVGFSTTVFHEICEFFLQMFLSQGSSKVANAPLWFVPCLFAVEIMYYFISKMRRRNIVVVCCLLTFFGWLLESGCLPFNNKLLPWSLDSALFALGFYALGNLMQSKVKNAIQQVESSKHKTLISVTTMIVCAILIVPLVYLNGKVSLGSKTLNNGFLLYTSGIFGTIGVLAAAVLLKRSKLLKFCGLNSFYIMSTHYLIRVIYRAGQTSLGFESYDTTDFVQTIIPFIVVMTASIVFTILYNKIKNAILNKNYT